MVADMEVDKVANIVANNNNFKKIDIDINMEIQFGERAVHWAGLVNWAQTFSIWSLPELRIYCEFIKKNFYIIQFIFVCIHIYIFEGG